MNSKFWELLSSMDFYTRTVLLGGIGFFVIVLAFLIFG